MKLFAVICRHFYGFSDKFNSVTAIWMKITDELGDQVLEKLNFNVGYYEGKKQSKFWFVCTEDFVSCTQFLQFCGVMEMKACSSNISVYVVFGLSSSSLTFENADSISEE